MLYKHPHCKIIIRHMRLWCWSTEPDSLSMIISQSHRIKLRNLV